jgi:hypothetical protein
VALWAIFSMTLQCGAALGAQAAAIAALRASARWASGVPPTEDLGRAGADPARGARTRGGSGRAGVNAAFPGSGAAAGLPHGWA